MILRWPIIEDRFGTLEVDRAGSSSDFRILQQRTHRGGGVPILIGAPVIHYIAAAVAIQQEVVACCAIQTEPTFAVSRVPAEIGYRGISVRDQVVVPRGEPVGAILS